MLFLALLRGTPGEGLGFAAEGWRVAVVDAAEVSLDPELWHPRFAPPPPAEPIGLVAAQGLLAEGEHILGFATTEPGDHAGHLARWLGSDLAAGRLDRVEWWSGEARGWIAGTALGRATPPAVIDDAAPEFSVHRDRRAGAFVHTASLGFGATNLGVRFAERPQGPWTAPLPIYTPPESGAPGILVYAGKAHPELEAGAAPDGTPWLAATYATNTLNDFARLVADTNLYYPRFVRIWIAPAKGTP